MIKYIKSVKGEVVALENVKSFCRDRYCVSADLGDGQLVELITCASNLVAELLCKAFTSIKSDAENIIDPNDLNAETLDCNEFIGHRAFV